MKTDEIQVNAEQIKAAWRLMQTRLEFAKESLELVDTASALKSIECVLALMDIMQGDIEDAPEDITELDIFVQSMVDECYPTRQHIVHNPSFVNAINRSATCETCGLFYAKPGIKQCGFCEESGSESQ